MRIHFLGGIETVTGSRYLLEANGSRILRDCGLFQGHRKEAWDRNCTFQFPAEALHAVVLSHAHIDHCGNLPSLARRGFRGPIHSTTATVSLCELMLRDSARIQEQDAAYLNQKTNRRGLPSIDPLYTMADADQAISQFTGHRYGEEVEVAPGITADYHDAGHILGAALNRITLSENGRTHRVGFAFDLGRRNLPLLNDPVVLRDVDDLILESTYGNRLHSDVRGAEDELADVVSHTIKRGGRVLIPSFALERAQELLYHFAVLFESGRLQRVPVYVDSPLATAVTQVFDRQTSYFDEDYHRLRERIGRVFHAPWVTFVQSVEESKALTASDTPCIVISASGMCEYGRILHHLKHGIEKPANTVLIVGFQAAHTLGRRLADGEKRARIFGDWFRVRADVRVLNAFSAHADRNDLLEYVRAVRPKRVFLVHGETSQRTSLAEALKTEIGVEVHMPARCEVLEL